MQRGLFSWGAGSWFADRQSSISGFRWSLSPNEASSCGDNGLFGGQLQPCLVFVASAAAVVAFDTTDNGSSRCASSQQVSDQFVWGVFARLVAGSFAIAFASLRPQVAALAGNRGLYPVGAMLAQARRDMPAAMPRCVYFPAGWLWWWSDDGMLRATCTAGLLSALTAAYGGAAAQPALFVAWLC